MSFPRIGDAIPTWPSTPLIDYEQEPIRLARFSDSQVVTSGSDGKATLQSVVNPDEKKVFTPYMTKRIPGFVKDQDEVTSMAKISDVYLMTGTASGVVHFWDVTNGSLKRYILADRQESFDCIAFLGSDLLIKGGKEGVKVCRLNPSNLAMENPSSPLLWGRGGSITSFTGIDAECFASSSEDGMIRVWNTRKLCTTLKGHTNAVMRVVYLNNSRLLSGSLDSTARIWDIEQGKLLHQLTDPGFSARYTHSLSLTDVAQYDSDTVLTAGKDGFLKFWDTRQTTSPKIVFNVGQIRAVCTLSFSNIVTSSWSSRLGHRVIAWDPRMPTAPVEQSDKA